MLRWLPDGLRSQKLMTTSTETDLIPADEHPNDFKDRYARAAIYSGVGGVVSQILYGLTPVIVARFAGPSDYGVYAIVMSLVAIVTGLLSLGQNSMLHKLLPEYSVKDRRQGGAILANTVLLTVGLLGVLSVLLLSLSGWLAASVYRDADLAGVFRWAVFATMAMGLFNLVSSVAAGLQDFRTYNRGLLLRSAALIAFVWLGVSAFGLVGAIAGQMLANLLGLGLITYRCWPLAHERFPGFVRLSMAKPLLSVMAGFTLPTLAMTLLNLPAYWWISTMVARHAGFAEAGHFSAAYTIAQLIFLLPLALYTPAMTFMSEAHAADQSGLFSRLAGSNLKWLWALTLPLALAGALAAPLIIKSAFGAAYAAAIAPAVVMSLAALLMVNTGLLNTAIIAAGRGWQGCWIASLWAAVFFVAGLICIPRWGALGGAMAFTISQLFYFVAAYLYSRWALRITNDRLGHLIALTLFSAIAAIFIAFLIREPVFYIASAVLLSLVISAEWSWISNAVERQRLKQAASAIAGKIAYGFRESFV